MKKIISFILLSLLIANIYAISSIVSITNDELRFEYDVYSGHLVSYEDKLIASHSNWLNEYIMLPDGQLERVSSIELGTGSSGILSYNDRLIVPSLESNPPNGFYLYDLSQTPMELITFVSVSSNNYIPKRGNTVFHDNKIMIYNPFNNGFRQYNLDTGEYEGFIYHVGNNGDYFEKIDDIFIKLKYADSHLQLYSLNENNVFEEISSTSISGYGTIRRQISVKDNYIFIATNLTLLKIDISNPTNPIIQDTYINGLLSFYSSDTHIYGFSNPLYFVVYELNNMGNYQMIHSQEVPGQYSNYFPHNIYYSEPYVYLSAELALFVFDENENYEVVNRYGRSTRFPVIRVGEDDVYYMEIDVFSARQNIYSVIDNTLITSLNYAFLTDEVYFPALPLFYINFKLINDRLCVLVRDDTYTYSLDIYQLEGQSAILLNSVPLPYISYSAGFEIIADRLFITNLEPLETFVIHLDYNTISYLGSFSGRIQFYVSEQPTDYIFNLDGEMLYIRDINDPLNFISQAVIPPPNPSYFHYLSDNYIVTVNDDPNNQAARLFYININNGDLTLISSFTSNQFTIKNEIITYNIGSNYTPHISNFYNIQNNELVQIGNLHYGTRDNTPNATYFFPERNKKVFVGSGGIWVYDVEFDYDVSEKEEVVDLKTGLLGNYPNPFNPSTNIKFSLAVASNLRVDIYNIKGQKILTLVDDFYPAGEHSIVWNGTDDRGYSVSSGVYLYKMTAGEYVGVGKMVMMK